MPEPETVVVEAIRELLARRDAAAGVDIARDAAIQEDLGLESLEVAELSVMLEDDLGSDPYSAGIVPRTVGELVDFYAA